MGVATRWLIHDAGTGDRPPRAGLDDPAAEDAAFRQREVDLQHLCPGGRELVPLLDGDVAGSGVGVSRDPVVVPGRPGGAVASRGIRSRRNHFVPPSVLPHRTHLDVHTGKGLARLLVSDDPRHGPGRLQGVGELRLDGLELRGASR